MSVIAIVTQEAPFSLFIFEQLKKTAVPLSFIEHCPHFHKKMPLPFKEADDVILSVTVYLFTSRS